MNLNLIAVFILFGLLQSAIMILLIFRNRNWKQLPNKLLIALLFVVGLTLIPNIPWTHRSYKTSRLLKIPAFESGDFCSSDTLHIPYVCF